MPDVVFRRIEREAGRVERFGMHPYRSAHTAAEGVEQPLVALFYGDFEHIAVPAHRAGADLQIVFVAAHRLAPALGHHPAMAGTIQRDIDAGMIERVAPAAALVIGAENAAQKGDDGQPVLPVGADGIDIPPGVAARWNRFIEARSRSTTFAASRPDKAAIGTPAEGCVAPPTQYSPGILVFGPWRRKEAAQPCEALP